MAAASHESLVALETAVNARLASADTRLTELHTQILSRIAVCEGKLDEANNTFQRDYRNLQAMMETQGITATSANSKADSVVNAIGQTQEMFERIHLESLRPQMSSEISNQLSGTFEPRFVGIRTELDVIKNAMTLLKDRVDVPGGGGGAGGAPRENKRKELDDPSNKFNIDKFEGKDRQNVKKFKVWRGQAANLLDKYMPKISEVLEILQYSKDVVTKSVFEAAVAQVYGYDTANGFYKVDEQLRSFLVDMLLEDAVAATETDQKSGLERWRRLTEHFEPRSATQKGTLRARVGAMNAKQAKNMTEMEGLLREYEVRVREAEAQDMTISDDEKAATLVNMMPKDMSEKMRMSKLDENFEEMRNYIKREGTENRVKKVRDDPMDIGAVAKKEQEDEDTKAQEELNAVKGKGKGKAGPNQCRICWKEGHMSWECPESKGKGGDTNKNKDWSSWRPSKGKGKSKGSKGKGKRGKGYSVENGNENWEEEEEWQEGEWNNWKEEEAPKTAGAANSFAQARRSSPSFLATVCKRSFVSPNPYTPLQNPHNSLCSIPLATISPQITMFPTPPRPHDTHDYVTCTTIPTVPQCFTTKQNCSCAFGGCHDVSGGVKMCDFFIGFSAECIFAFQR